MTGKREKHDKELLHIMKILEEYAVKILVLNGSPKLKSDTFRLTDAFLKGMNRNGEHEVHIVHVRERRSRHAGDASAAGSAGTATA